MANELKHSPPGAVLTQDEYKAVAAHVLDSQAQGDIIRATSTTQLSRLAIGAANTVLVSDGSDPSWSASITIAGLGVPLTLENSTDGVSNQVALFRGDNATRADNDEIYASFSLDDDGGNETEFVRMSVVATDVSNTTEDGRLDIAVMTAGTLADELSLTGAALYPSTDDGLALGITNTNEWSDLFLASGAVVNFNNGDVTLTHSANLLTLAGGNFNFGSNIVFIGDTSNANMTAGLTINQGANDDQILALKSSDVATGLSTGGFDLVETDDFFAISKSNGLLGGAKIIAIAEDGAVTSPLTFSVMGGTANTTKTAAGIGLVNFQIAEHNGANALADITADGNVFTVRARVGGAVGTVFIVDEDGDLLADGGIASTNMVTLFDAEDDIALVRGFDEWRAEQGALGIVRDRFDAFVHANEDRLVELGIVGRRDDEGNHGLINVTRLQQLHNGAIWQIATDLYEIAATLPAESRARLPERLQNRLALIGA